MKKIIRENKKCANLKSGKLKKHNSNLTQCGNYGYLLNYCHLTYFWQKFRESNVFTKEIT